MNSIDALSSSLYFSAVTNASKEATKGKKVEKSNKTSFSSMVKKSQEVEELLSSGLPIEIAGMEIEEAVAFYVFTQYIFFTQWRSLKDYANSKNVFILGDMPIYVSRDSADVWSDVSLFEINEKSRGNHTVGHILTGQTR